MAQNCLCNITEFKQSKTALDTARTLLKDNKYAEAVELARIAHKYHPESEDAIFTCAQALYLCGYENQAIDLFEMIEDYEDPYYAGAGVCFYLADCYCMANYNLFKALKLINKALELDKENPQRVNNELEVKGRILYAMGYYDEVLPVFEGLYNTAPSIMLEIYLSKTYFKKGNYLKSYLYFTKIFNYYENDSVNLNYEEMQCYLDIKLNKYSKEHHINVNEKIKQSIKEKLGIRKTPTPQNIEGKKFHIPVAEVLLRVYTFVNQKNINGLKYAILGESLEGV